MVPMAQFEKKPVNPPPHPHGIGGGDVPAANLMPGDALCQIASRCSAQGGSGPHWACHHQLQNPRPAGFQMPAAASYITRTRIDDDHPCWYPSACTGLGTRHCQFGRTKVTCRDLYPGFFGDLYGANQWWSSTPT